MTFVRLLQKDRRPWHIICLPFHVGYFAGDCSIGGQRIMSKPFVHFRKKLQKAGSRHSWSEWIFRCASYHLLISSCHSSLFSSNFQIINDNQWWSMIINDNQWKSMKTMIIRDNQWLSMITNDNQWYLTKLVGEIFLWYNHPCYVYDTSRN